MANRLEAVDPMVLQLKERVEEHLGTEAQFRFDICVSEALANLVLHAQTDRKDTLIDLSLGISDDEVVIVLFDPVGADAFDLRDHARALSDVDAMAESGRGLGLILECADQVDYGAADRRNRLSLTFRERA